ncbi:MAG TPA: Stp1/IreP family PP2C-type Ser/Thr phosphatase [Firmicutes bacterium]|jgi:serine/threonine protein phosphatase PrpC|nr:Stp1/IreP family PP2C-type Ser/Thr phosphatase [Bacillota bacterium]
MKVGMATHVGKVRAVNEDSIGCKGMLLVLADGMGGHQAGEVASALVVERVLALEAAGPDFKTALIATLNEANEALLAYASAHQECLGMGTTVVVAKVEGDRLYVAHIGDSRAYLWRRGTCTQLTTDHSLVTELVRSGGITPEEAKNHPQRNILTRALGAPGPIEPEYQEFPVVAEDRLLLCSDGLTVMLSDEEIGAVLGREESPQRAADSLVAAANDRGGLDNVSAITAFL